MLRQEALRDKAAEHAAELAEMQRRMELMTEEFATQRAKSRRKTMDTRRKSVFLGDPSKAFAYVFFLYPYL